EAAAVSAGRVSGPERAGRIEELERYLLTRLAAQRSESPGGALPMVLDDPFAGLTGDEAVGVATTVERLAGAVQVLVLSDEPALVRWAEELGPERASVVRAG